MVYRHANNKAFRADHCIVEIRAMYYCSLTSYITMQVGGCTSTSTVR